MATKYSADGRLGRLLVAGGTLKADVVEAVTSANLSLSATENTQLTIALREDAEFTYLTSGLFKAGGIYTEGTLMAYDDLRLECRSVELAPRGTDHALTIVARSLAIGRLKRWRGRRVLHNVSPTDYAALSAKTFGLKFLGEPTARRRSISRASNESEWDVLTRLAGECGFSLFETSQTLFFGRPTHLITRTKQLPISWRGKDTDDGLDELPRVRRSGDDPRGLVTFTASLRGTLADQARPGQGAPLTGIPGYTGRYMVTGVTVPLADAAPVTVDAASPIDPERM